MMKFLTLLIWLSLSTAALAQTSPQEQDSVKAEPSRLARPVNPQLTPKLLVMVTDGNGVPVPSALVTLIQSTGQTVIKGETDYAGRREFSGLNPEVYRLRVEKEGFYAVSLGEIRVVETETVGVTLFHEQEIRETISVMSSPPAIDPTNTTSNATLNSKEVINIPYATTRDYRNVLPFISSRVLRSPTGQVHVNGSASYQLYSQLDGFNISQPSTGLLDIRVSPDALRTIEVQGSRNSAEFGKGSGGVLSLATGMGDDKYRFNVTDFVPSFQTRKGVNINGWTPRATFSGPIRKNRAWFFNAVDAEYNLDIIDELPSGADRNQGWRINNLAKAQVNLTQANILTTSFLVNQFHADHAGLSQFSPIETTRDLQQSAYLLTVKDQSYLANGLSLEAGFGISQFRVDQQPLGISPYVISTEGTSGNFFKTSEGISRRMQWLANLTLPPIQFYGRHEVRVGVDLDRVTYRQTFERRPMLILRADGSLSRLVTFNGGPELSKNNFAVSGYAQDRLSVSDNLLIEFGLRTDWDAIIRQVLFSPRIATTYLLSRLGETKISGGIGLYYDSTNLSFITRSQEGLRFDQFYEAAGQTPLGLPVESSFLVNERSLKSPRFLNWSVGLERKMPAELYLRVEYLERRGSDGFTFINRDDPQTFPPNGRFELRNDQRDRYKAVSFNLRRAFKNGYEVFVSYTRSSARSNAVFDFSLDRIVFTRQAAGPLSWDSPNRLISWGWLPLVKGFDLAYLLEWRSGYPYSLFNEDQQLVGTANSSRFPSYFSLNLHAEKRFRFLGVNLALRAGFNNLTNRDNPSEINNNVDSPKFMTFGGVQNRAFVGRIRFLGRK
jgi:hypothetical protein